MDAAVIEASRGPQVQVVLDFTVERARSKTRDDLGFGNEAHALMERYLGG